MLFVDNQNIYDPRTNLAIEEYLLRFVTTEEPLLLFYINEPSVIIGRNQNKVEEIDPQFTEVNQIHVVRRLSGGGAVYHDFGNLNYSFITNGRTDLHNFAKFLQPVISTLNNLGVQAEQGGSSDILVDGKKVSGNAQYSTPTRMFSHGTLLFDTDLKQMLQALNPRQHVIESKAVQSVRSSVANIKQFLPDSMDIHLFRTKLLQGIFQTAEIPTYSLSQSDWAKIETIRSQHYANWEWNDGRAPEFDVQKEGQFGFVKLDGRIGVGKGRIKTLKLYGNFFGEVPVAELENMLIGVPFTQQAIENALEGVSVSTYINSLPNNDFIHFLIH